MSAFAAVILIFSIIGAVDYLLGNKIGAGNEFKKAFSLFEPMALSMIGMIVIAPAIGQWIEPLFDVFYHITGVDPSVISASLLANDMGGLQLSKTVAKSLEMGNFNGYIVSSMLGCVISFTIPFSIGLVKKEQHSELFFGILCGIVTIPVGCFVSGLMCRIPITALLVNLVPLIIFSAILAVGLVLIPEISIKCFSVFGKFVKMLAVLGLVSSLFTFVTKIEVCRYFDTFENAALICANACVTLSGALPLMFIVSKVLKKPLDVLGAKLGVNGISALAFLGSIVTNATTFAIMDKMDKKGAALNSAFAVSASFALGSHLAFTMVFDESYVPAVIIGKLVSGICGLLLAMVLYKEKKAKS